MTIRYVDPAAGGDNNGTSWIHAWTSIQSAFDTAVAGDVVYCRGTQTLSATLDLDTQSGSNAAGYIKFIGCNSSGNVDGTRFVISGGSGAYHGITCAATAIMYWFENFEIALCGNSTSYHGVQFNTSGSSGCVFVNCTFHNCNGNGVYAYRANQALFWRCAFYLNVSSGIYYPNNAWIIFCRFYDNGGDGIELATYTNIIGSLIYDNGDDGVDGRTGTLLFNCAVDSNPDDGVFKAGSTGDVIFVVIGCRITNHSGTSGGNDIGLNVNSEPCVAGYNFFDNNADHISGEGGAWYQFIPIEGGSSTSNTYVNEAGGGGGDTNQGYTDTTEDAEDFNLRSDATLRRTAITIPRT